MQRPRIVILGAGPAGSVCAHQLASQQIPVILLDKETFPRDKICGDALNPDVIYQLGLIDPGLKAAAEVLPTMHPTKGVKIITSNGHELDIPIRNKYGLQSGYVCPRMDFDHLLFNQAIKNRYVTVHQNCKVESIYRAIDHIVLQTNHGNIQADVVVGADGAQSIVSRQLAQKKIDRSSQSAGLRMYYENITGFNEGQYVELHFLKELMPGYLWLFPMANNRANVGLGMLSKDVGQKKINLRERLKELILHHPSLKERFRNAKPLEEMKGFGLPLCTHKQSISGDRYVLVGDAASLIDPLTGEGISNAIRSGRIAADHIKKAVLQNNYSASFNKNYDDEIYRKMWPELKVSTLLFRSLKYPFLPDLLIKKANQNKVLKQFILDLLIDVQVLKRLWSLGFYRDLMRG